jgi:hypothetical protein
MPGRITHIPGTASKKWGNGRTIHKPSRETAERLKVVATQAKEELATPLEQSIGIMRARTMVTDAGLSVEAFNTALAAGEIFGAEKQGPVWHISPSEVSAWIRSRP